MARPGPGDGDGLHGAGQGPQVFHRQVVVGGGENVGRRADEGADGLLPGGGEGEPLVEGAAQGGGVGLGVQTDGGGPELIQRAGLAAEREMAHHSGGREDLHRTPGEVLRGGDRPGGGQLQYQVGAAL